MTHGISQIRPADGGSDVDMIENTMGQNRSLKRCRVGSMQWHQERKQLPPGPSSMSDLYNYQERSWEDLISGRGGQIRALRFEANMHRGILSSSLYSGKGTSESALHYLETLAKKKGMAAHVTSMHACDRKSSCQQILLPKAS